MLGKGNGRPVLLLHGMSTSADSFRETLYGLADQFWLIAPDIPGFGYSDMIRPYSMDALVAWLHALLCALNLPSVALMGHSFGGVLAAAYALAYPAQVNRLLLVAPSILSNTAYPDYLKKIAVELGLLDAGTAISQSSLWVRRQIRAPVFAPERQDESVWRRRLFDYEQARASAEVLKISAFFDLRPLLPDLYQPVCLVWGENDPVVQPTDAEKLAHLLPNATIHYLPECGHISILEQPQAFQAVARSFLNNSEDLTL